MVKVKPNKWSLTMTWRRREDFVTKAGAEQALKDWKARKEADGWTVFGSLSSGYFARLPGVDFTEEMAKTRRGIPPEGLASCGVQPIDVADSAPNEWNGPDATDG